MPEATSNEPNAPHEAGSNRLSRLMQVVAGVYVLILVGAIILAGMFFINFSISKGTPMAAGGYEHVVLEPNANFTYKMAVVFKTGGNDWRVGVPEGDTEYYDFPPPTRTLTAWRTISIWADLDSNETFNAWTYVFYPDGHNETYQHLAVGTGLIDYQNAQAGTYTIKIWNTGSQEINALIRKHFSVEVFEKPYFYYGVYALVIALVAPVVFIIKRVVSKSF